MIIDATVTQTLAPLTRAGRYTVTYRVVSADGHPVSAALPFTYAPPGVPFTQQSGGAVPAPAGHGSSRLPWWLGAGAVVIVAGAAAVAIARRRARPSTVSAGG